MQYSLDQTIFMLSMASNAVADIKATISGYQTELTGYMKVALNGGSLKDVASYGAFSDYQGAGLLRLFPCQQLAVGGWRLAGGVGAVRLCGAADGGRFCLVALCLQLDVCSVQ